MLADVQTHFGLAKPFQRVGNFETEHQCALVRELYGVVQTGRAFRRRLPRHRRQAAGKPIEFWWQDEARVGQQGTLTYIWTDRGSRPPMPRDLRYE